MLENGWDIWGVTEENKRFGEGIGAGGFSMASDSYNSAEEAAVEDLDTERAARICCSICSWYWVDGLVYLGDRKISCSMQ